MPADTSVPVSAPATQSGGSPSTPTTPAGGYTSTQDMFADMDKLLGLDAESIPNTREARPSKPATEEDFLGLGEEENTDESSTDDAASDDTIEDGPVADDKPAAKEGGKTAFPAYKFKQEVAGKSYDLDIKSPEQLNTIVSKALIADQVYSKYNTLKEEVETLREDKAALDNIDSMIEKNPHELLNHLTGDMPDDVLREWIMAKAAELNEDPQARDIRKKLKNADLIEQKLARIEAEQERLNQQRKQAALESDKHTVGSWMEGKRSLLGAKVPEKYSSIVEDQLRYVIMEARDKNRNGEKVTIKTLDSMLNLKMQPLLALIAQDKPTRNVDKEVGQALQSKKEQNLSRIQSSTSASKPSSNQAGMKKIVANKDNPIGIFDEVLKGMDSGRLQLRKG